MSDLPNGWIWTDTATVAEVQGGIQKQPKRRPTVNYYPFLRVANVMRGRLDLRDVHEIELFDGELEKFRLRAGDLLVVEGNGSPDQIGRAALWHGNIPDCVHQNHIIRIRPTAAIDPKYFIYYWNASQTTEYLRSVASSTSGLYVLTATKVRNVQVPLPPLKEQRRIVTAIEEQFPRLDAGVAALERVRLNLQRARRAVLNRVIGFEAGAKLPNGWQWVTVKDVAGDHSNPVLTGPFGTTLSRSDFRPDGVHVLTIGCLSPDGITLDLAPYVSDTKAKTLQRYSLRSGDVLFSRMATVGRAAVVREAEAGSLINYHLMRLRLDSTMIVPDFLVLLCRGSRAIQQYLSDSNHGVTRPGINTRQLLGLPVALPPLSEQWRIVRLVRSADDFLSQLERENSAVIARASHLRSSLLKTAFSGKLVAQDSSEEPASALLERVTAEQARGNDLKCRRIRKVRGMQEEVTA